jgi:hypothetical protein
MQEEEYWLFNWRIRWSLGKGGYTSTWYGAGRQCGEWKSYFI